MTSRTHDNFRHNFWTWVDPPPPVWTMFKKTALFWKGGIPNDARDGASNDACDDEASSAKPTASMLIWTFRFKRHGNLSFFIVHFSSGTRKWPDSEMRARNHWSFGCENCLGEKQTFDPRGNKDVSEIKRFSQYFCSGSVVFQICSLLWLEPGYTNRLNAKLKQIWGG